MLTLKTISSSSSPVTIFSCFSIIPTEAVSILEEAVVETGEWGASTFCPNFRGVLLTESILSCTFSAFWVRSVCSKFSILAGLLATTGPIKISKNNKCK